MQLCKGNRASQQLAKQQKPANKNQPFHGLPRLLKQTVQRSSTGAKSSDNEEIYIGFKKDDFAPREGRQGRVIIDDPKKYPAKEDFMDGLLVGLSGGWAGGEAALVVQREQFKNELKSQKKSAAPKSSLRSSPRAGPAPIYVGFGKDELDAKNTGVPGRIIYDDAAKYPDKDDVGPFAGATGGFAGGERGLRGYIETGEVRLRKPGQPGGQGMAPLSIAFLILTAGGIGATVVLTGVYDVSVSPAVQLEELRLKAVSIEGSETLLTSLGAGFAALTAVAAVRYVVSSAVAKVQESAESIQRAAILAAFSGAVVLAVKAVLEI